MAITVPGKNQNGFTLLEVLLVITLLGFLAAMVAPMAFELDDASRAKRTRQRLDDIRNAIVGPINTVDASGQPLLQGYVSDMARPPDLYLGTWDEAEERWVYFQDLASPGTVIRRADKQHESQGSPFYIVVSEGWKILYADPEVLSDTGSFASLEDFENTIRRLQPIDLWDGDSRLDLLPEGAWKGPYAALPHDEFARDTAHFEYERDSANLKIEYEMRRTEGRLADAWGRSFVFWPRYEDDRIDLYVISEGPDRESGWGEQPTYHYLEGDPRNQDNVVLIIRHNEWYEKIVGAVKYRTVEILETIRTALAGPRNRFDDQGRRILGGYIADLGGLPGLYERIGGLWQEDLTPLIEGQPRGLWTRDLNGDGAPDQAELWVLPDHENGRGWRGPYYPGPWSRGSEDDTIRDAWGRDIIFRRNVNDLRAISRGPDGISDNADDIVLKLTENEWLAAYRDDAGESTRRQIGSIRAALLGARSAIDKLGRPIVAGFIGDTGDFPALYAWDDSRSCWPDRYVWDQHNSLWEHKRWTAGNWAFVDYSAPPEGASPRGLWTNDPVGDGPDNGNELPPLSYGCGWRSAYLDQPSGTGEDEALRDAWQRRILFLRDAEGLWIISEGPDAESDLSTPYSLSAPANRDNVTTRIEDSEWRPSGNLSGISFSVANARAGITRASLYYGPGLHQDLTADEETWTDSFPNPQIRVQAGVRTVVIWEDSDGDGLDQDDRQAAAVFVVDGAGTPDREALEIRF